MECEKRHVCTHRLAKACAHCKIVVVNIVVHASEHDALAADLLSSLCKVDLVIGFVTCSAVETSIEKDRILFNRVGKMITLQ